jgi:hypothetical protein
MASMKKDKEQGPAYILSWQNWFIHREKLFVLRKPWLLLRKMM